MPLVSMRNGYRLAMVHAARAKARIAVTTSRAWTGGEFKAVADKASKAASLYRAPGKSRLQEGMMRGSLKRRPLVNPKF
jgi:hypothetical protein